jgi:hypothetical protein
MSPESRAPVTSPVNPKKTIRKTEAVPALSESQTTVDLTNRFKLSSTGTSAKGGYASIDGGTYYLGDEFEGMMIMEIRRDRVFLKEKNGWQQFKIVFRYKN